MQPAQQTLPQSLFVVVGGCIPFTDERLKPDYGAFLERW